MTTPTISPFVRDSLALDVIALTLSGTEWTPDTLKLIAAIVRQTGRTIEDVTA